MFAKVLRQGMVAHGIKGRSLATEMGVREQTVSEWRRGTYRPEGADLIRLASILHVSPEELRADDENAVAPSGNERARTTETGVDFWRGVLYAAETMSATVTSLLREQRLAADRANSDDARGDK